MQGDRLIIREADHPSLKLSDVEESPVYDRDIAAPSVVPAETLRPTDHLDSDTVVPLEHFVRLAVEQKKLEILRNDKTRLFFLLTGGAVLLVLCSMLVNVIFVSGALSVASWMFGVICLMESLTLVAPEPQGSADQVVFNPTESTVVVPTAVLHDLQQRRVGSRVLGTSLVLVFLVLAALAAIHSPGGGYLVLLCLALHLARFHLCVFKRVIRLNGLKRKDTPSIWQF